MPRVLVAGIGNIFRGDDGFGSAVLAALAGCPLPGGVRAVDYGIRGLHLAYDLLDGWDALVLVDALPGEPAGEVRVLQIGPDDVPSRPPGAALDAHGTDPTTVLAALDSLGGRLPDRTVLVGCSVADVGEGMGLTPGVAARVGPAVEVVLDLVGELTGSGGGGLRCASASPAG